MITDTDKFLAERKTWLEAAARFIEPRRAVDLGCGSGFVVEFMADQYPASSWTAADIDLDRLNKLRSRKIGNVSPLRCDLMQISMSAGIFDTVTVAATTHGLFNKGGMEAIGRLMKEVDRVLIPGGCLVIQDFLRPDPETVLISFSDDSPWFRFLGFAERFRPRRIEYDHIDRVISLDKADAIDFLSKSRLEGKRWEEAIDETHLCFTLDQLEKLGEAAGFFAIDARKWPIVNWDIGAVGDDIDYEFDTEIYWGQLVLKKPD